MQNLRKNHHRRTVALAQLCSAKLIPSQLRHVHVSAIGKKLVKQQYLLRMSSNMVNFGPLAVEISWRVWAPRQILTGFLPSLLQRRPSTELNQTLYDLAVFWADTLYIHFWGLCPLTKFCQVQYSLCV